MAQNMSGTKMFHKLFTLTCLCLLVYCNNISNAEFTLKDLWNATGVADNSSGCTLEINEEEDEFIFTGAHSGEVCRVIISSEISGTLIQTLHPLPLEAFVYMKKQREANSCDGDEYVVVNVAGYASCSLIGLAIWSTEFEIHVEGNASMVISDVNETVPMCTDMFDSWQIPLHPYENGTPLCDLSGYNHTISCLLTSDLECSFEPYPIQCINTLGNRFIEYDCPHTSSHSSQKSLILFPSLMESLDLSWQNIDIVSDYAFVTLNRLYILDLGYNRLSKVNRKTFAGLTSLWKLYLTFNNINTLDIDVFYDLGSLSYLHMRGNGFESLPSNLLWNAKYLTYLNLGDNLLTSLDDDFLKEATSLTHLYLYRNKLTSLNANMLRKIKHLSRLVVYQNEVVSIDNDLLKAAITIELLNIRHNKIQNFPKQLLSKHSYLKVLSASDNYVTEISYDFFWPLRNMTFLRLGYNQLQDIDQRTFVGLRNLEVLFLEFNQIRAFHVDTFRDTVSLKLLELSGNQFTDIPNIGNLNQLAVFGLQDNKLTSVDSTTFIDLPKEVEVIVSPTEICKCYIPDGVKCTAVDVQSPYLTCDRLLSNRVLMVLMWIMGLNALYGNIFVLGRKKSHSERNKVQTFLLSNLAISDLLMGVYMLIIAGAGIYFGHHFPLKAETWRSRITCRVAGALSMLSSEASVFFVTLISIDRFIIIRFPYARFKINKTSSLIIVASLWAIGFVLALIPSILAGSNYKFYDISHVCIGLPLAQNELFSKNISLEWVHVGTYSYYKSAVTSQSLGYVPGLYYASALFLGLNGLCYLVILICYVEIVRSVYRSSKRAGLNKDAKEQIRMTTKVAAIVLTDFLCWAPVIVLGILVQANSLRLSASVFAWMVTVVLPINSAVNPYLYTIVDVVNARRKRARIAASESQQNSASMEQSNTHSTRIHTVSQMQSRVNPVENMPGSAQGNVSEV